MSLVEKIYAATQALTQELNAALGEIRDQVEFLFNP